MKRTEVVAFRLAPELVKLLDEYAARALRSRANLLQFITTDWIMDHAADKLVDAPVEYRTEEAGNDHVPH